MRRPPARAGLVVDAEDLGHAVGPGDAEPLDGLVGGGLVGAAGAVEERGDGGRAELLDGRVDDGGAGDDQGVGGDVVVAAVDGVRGVVAGDGQRPAPCCRTSSRAVARYKGGVRAR